MAVEVWDLAAALVRAAELVRDGDLPGALSLLRGAFPSREDDLLLRAVGVRVGEGMVPSSSEPVRASGDAVCPGCGRAYRLHRADPELGWSGEGEARPFLRRLCDGTRVKL